MGPHVVPWREAWQAVQDARPMAMALVEDEGPAKTGQLDTEYRRRPWWDPPSSYGEAMHGWSALVAWVQQAGTKGCGHTTRFRGGQLREHAWFWEEVCSQRQGHQQ
jgi:hypothetical protein